MSRNVESILDQLSALRDTDAPTHGGKLLSYVYDHGLPELDRLAARAMTLSLPVNGLDPTMFPSVPAMERDLIAFTRTILNGDHGRGSRRVVGSLTSGGTESCMLAVKTARERWRAQRGPGTPRLVAPQTVHAAFHKAAQYFGLTLDLVPVSPDGIVSAADVIDRLDTDVALVVVSAPSYPTAQLDPVEEVAAAAHKWNISCHVDACIGGFALPFWKADLPPWDFRVPGVTSISADLHKFGFAPKGASVLLQRGRARQRLQFFATKRWPGYPIVNSTLLGSRSATSLSAAWAIALHLGVKGYTDLTHKSQRATTTVVHTVHHIRGLRVMGDPTGPLVALTADESVPPEQRVDPHHLADELSKSGFLLQHQPGITQANGVHIPHSVHLTFTPVTESRIREFIPALTEAADAVRGKARANPRFELTAMRLLGLLRPDASLTTGQAALLLRVMGMGGPVPNLPKRMASLMRLLEEMPHRVAEAILVEIIAQLSEPVDR